MNSRKDIIWALDPYEENIDLQFKGLPIVNDLSKSLNARIRPVFILSPYSFETKIDRIVQPLMDQFRDRAKSKMEDLLNKITELDNEAPEILVCNKNSLTDSVKTLNDYAVKNDAQCIICATHARSGLGRFWLGSFTETLLHISETPLVTYNPDTEISDSIKKILLPSDFENSSKKIFDYVVSMAKTLNAEIEVVTALPRIGLYAPYGSVSSSEHLFDELTRQIEFEKNQRTEVSQEWMKEAQDSGVKTSFKIFTDAIDVDQSIEDIVEEGKYDLVALLSRTRPMEQILFGSLTRKIIRSAKCPVWAIHEDKI